MKTGDAKYQKLKKYLKYLLAADLFAFLVLMFSSASSTAGIKFFAALSTVLLSVLCLAILYQSQELLRNRSFWMTSAASAILLCSLCSLLLRFPSPNPLSQVNPSANTTESVRNDFTISGWMTESTLDTSESLVDDAEQSAETEDLLDDILIDDIDSDSNS